MSKEENKSINVAPNKLLHWVIKETTNISYENLPENHFEKKEEDPNISRLIDMTPEEREKWMTIIFGRPEDRISDTDRMKLVIAQLLKDKNGTKDEKIDPKQLEDLLQNLHFLCEVSYVAACLSKVDVNLDVVFYYCEHSEVKIREHAAWILHTATGNNLRFKKVFDELGGMKRVFNLIAKEANFIVQKKFLGVLVNMTRQFEPGLGKFISLGGVELITRWLHEEAPHVYDRCLKALNELLFAKVLSIEQLLEMKITQILIAALQAPKRNPRESAIAIIKILCNQKLFKLLNDETLLQVLKEAPSDEVFTEEHKAELKKQVKVMIMMIQRASTE